MLSLLAGVPALAACSSDNSPTQGPRQGIHIEPFSATRLHELLDALVAAYEKNGQSVSKTLLPPLNENALRARCAWFPGDLPPELIALYGWHNGQQGDAWEEKFPFWFRDCAFQRIEQAEAAYRSIMNSYGLNPFDRGLLEYCFPFAAFNGAWYVLPTVKQELDVRIARPVISVFEGVEIYFYSLQSMVQTCLDWVNHPSYSIESGIPSDVELSIWQHRNPGIFEY